MWHFDRAKLTHFLFAFICEWSLAVFLIFGRAFVDGNCMKSGSKLKAPRRNPRPIRPEIAYEPTTFSPQISDHRAHRRSPSWVRRTRAPTRCRRPQGRVPRAPRADSTEPVVLETNELGKVYRERSLFGKVREVAAASDVTLTLRKGRTLGIVGESGSGKSTLARCIVRLIDPTARQLAVRIALGISVWLIFVNTFNDDGSPATCGGSVSYPLATI